MDRHRHSQLSERMLPQQLALQRVAVSELVSPQREHLGVSDLDPFLAVGRYWVDAGLENVPAHPFQQPRISLLVPEHFEYLPSPLLLDHVGLDQLVAYPHSKPGYRRILRKREIKDPFQRLGVAGSIDKRLLDHSSGDLVADVDGHLVVPDR